MKRVFQIYSYLDKLVNVSSFAKKVLDTVCGHRIYMTKSDCNTYVLEILMRMLIRIKCGYDIKL